MLPPAISPPPVVIFFCVTVFVFPRLTLILIAKSVPPDPIAAPMMPEITFQNVESFVVMGGSTRSVVRKIIVGKTKRDYCAEW